MEAISLLGMLGLCTWEDIRKRQVHILLVLVFGILGVCFHLYYERQTIWDILGGTALGIVLYIISCLSEERIGKGDALLVMVTGIYLGFWSNLMLLWGAAMLAGIVGSAILFVKKKGRQTRLPFVPFLLAGYLILLWMWGGTLVS